MGIPLADSVPAIAGWLPFQEDEDEATFVHTYLCDLIDACVLPYSFLSSLPSSSFSFHFSPLELIDISLSIFFFFNDLPSPLTCSGEAAIMVPATLTKVLNASASAVAADLVDDACKARVKGSLLGLRARLPPADAQQLFASVPVVMA